MPKDIRAEDVVELRFGGGVNAIMSIDDIDPSEATEGENFNLEIGNFNFGPRKPFEKVFTTTNAGEIRGFIQLKKRDGSIFFAVQSADKVFSWDGVTTTEIATVPATANLRGRERAYWQLDDLVIITDLSLTAPVFQWDGTTFQAVVYAGFAEFRAKHCIVKEDRAFYANVFDQIAIPQLIAASALEDFTAIDVSNRTGSSGSLQPSDAGFMTALDLRAINGMLESFQTIIFSTEDGQIHQLDGSDASTFQLTSLFVNSGASGEEPIIAVGNDVLYGREGKIESLSGVLEFGDVESDDISILIKPLIKDAKQWDANYDPVTGRGYFWPDNENKVYVWKKDIQDVSPWVPWTTQHESNFAKTASMTLIDPRTNTRGVFWGDANGNVYLMEGGSDGDAGDDIIVTRTSALFSAPLDATAFDLIGHADIRTIGFPVTINITVKGHGVFLGDKTINLPLRSEANTEDGVFYGGDSFYGGGAFYGSQGAQKIQRYKTQFAGNYQRFQIEIDNTGKEDFSFNQEVLRFGTASETP